MENKLDKLEKIMTKMIPTEGTKRSEERRMVQKQKIKLEKAVPKATYTKTIRDARDKWFTPRTGMLMNAFKRLKYEGREDG